MKSVHILIALVLVLAIGVAAYMFFFNKPADDVRNDTKSPEAQKAEDLYLESLSFGKNASYYTYAYEEDRNGYVIRVLLMRNENASKVVFEVPLSTRTAYFLEGRTIGCIRIKNESETCTVTENATDVYNYLNELRALFFNDSQVDTTVGNAEYLAGRNLITFEDSLAVKPHPIGPCTISNFTINYTNLPILEAARFGLGPGSPLVFRGYFCVDEATHEPYEKYFAYSFRNRPVYTKFTVLQSDFGTAPKITPPENLSNVLFSTLIVKERDETSNFIRCYSDSGDLRDRCIYSYSIYGQDPYTCRYAGSKADQCLLNVAILKKDVPLCTSISSVDYRDDCYLELARLGKDASLCTSIQNESKGSTCVSLVTSNQSSAGPASSSVEPGVFEEAQANATGQ